MGTRFMSTIEPPIHQKIKEAIINAQETDTALVLRRWKNTSRLFANKVTQETLKIEKESKTGDFSEISSYVSGKRGRQVFLNGDPNHGVWYAGQVIGLIRDIPTCQVLLDRIEKEALEAINRTRYLCSEALASML